MSAVCTVIPPHAWQPVTSVAWPQGDLHSQHLPSDAESEGYSAYDPPDLLRPTSLNHSHCTPFVPDSRAQRRTLGEDPYPLIVMETLTP